jgi:antigen flippase
VTDSSARSKQHILKSTSIVGGAQVVSIVIGLARAKVLAVLLGPAGIGLLGLYNSLYNTAATIAGMGLRSSGVRQIAEATGAGDENRIAGVRLALKILTVSLASLGALALVAFSRPLSELTFRSPDYALDISLLAAGIFFMVVGGSQGAVLQGFRKIGDIARSNVLGSLAGTLVGILLVYLLRERGIAPMLIVSSAVACVLSWWFARRIPTAGTPGSAREIVDQCVFMLKLGSTFMLKGLMAVAVLLVVRALIKADLGLQAVGFFGASWSISRQYTDLVLGAMGQDFYPRLTAIHDDHAAVRKLVNEQLEVALLLAGPMILAMLTFAPVAIYLLYTPEFVAESAPILRWQVLGTLFRVLTFPLGFIIVAKGRVRLHIAVEFVWNAVFLLSVFAGLGRWGIEITGVAFLLAYVLHAGVNYVTARRLVDYRMNRGSRLLLVALTALTLAIGAAGLVDERLAYAVGAPLTLGFAWHAARSLRRIIGMSPWAYVARRLGR